MRHSRENQASSGLFRQSRRAQTTSPVRPGACVYHSVCSRRTSRARKREFLPVSWVALPQVPRDPCHMEHLRPPDSKQRVRADSFAFITYFCLALCPTRGGFTRHCRHRGYLIPLVLKWHHSMEAKLRYIVWEPGQCWHMHT